MSTEQEVKKGTSVLKVPYGLLKVIPGLNIRTNYGDIKDLGLRIFNSTDGLHNTPLVGYRDEGKLAIVHGHSRELGIGYVSAHLDEMLADYEADLPKELNKADRKNAVAEKREYIEKLLSNIPFILETRGVTDEQRVVDMITTNQGRPLNPMELSDAVKRLLAFGLSDKEIGDKISKTPAYVGKLKKLIGVDKEFAKLIIADKIAPTLAIEIASKGEVAEFMEKYLSGAYNNQSENNAEGGNGQQKRLTRKNVSDVNSFKFFKQFHLSVEADKLPPHKKEAFEFMVKVLQNKAGVDEFREYFSA